LQRAYARIVEKPHAPIHRRAQRSKLRQIALRQRAVDIAEQLRQIEQRNAVLFDGLRLLEPCRQIVRHRELVERKGAFSHCARHRRAVGEALHAPHFARC
jgi:hypothetical protein